MAASAPRLPDPELIAQLCDCVGSGRVITDPERRRLMSTDLYAERAICAAVIRPEDTASLARAARCVTTAGYALVPRGGGMSYTGGYTPGSPETVIVDMGDMTGIVSFSARDMTLTVRAGTTWETIYETLRSKGLRLPFFGTFSGRLATVGGGLSNGAVFFGTARYGSAADNTLGLEIVCADGRILRTGQAAFRNGKPFYRTQGPDMTGLFLHDGGALGIKTEATFRLIEMPHHLACLSFAFPDALSAAAALSAIGRSGAAEEAYVFDPETTRRNMARGDLRDDLQRLRRVVSGQRRLTAGLRAGLRLAAAGRRIVPAGAFSLHLVCAGRSHASVRSDLGHCRDLLRAHGGREIPDSIPLSVRAAPFGNLNGVLGPKGERWVALNAKVTHGDAPAIIRGFDAIVDRHADRMQAAGVRTSTLFVAMDTHAFSFEPVFHWADRWLPLHRKIPDPAHLAKLAEPQPNPAGTALVAELREQTLNLFSDLGAASNQIGRTYPYYDTLAPESRALLDAVKAELDPGGLMNPGVLAPRGRG